MLHTGASPSLGSVENLPHSTTPACFSLNKTQLPQSKPWMVGNYGVNTVAICYNVASMHNLSV